MVIADKYCQYYQKIFYNKYYQYNILRVNLFIFAKISKFILDNAPFPAYAVWFAPFVGRGVKRFAEDDASETAKAVSQGFYCTLPDYRFRPGKTQAETFPEARSWPADSGSGGSLKKEANRTAEV